MAVTSYSDSSLSLFSSNSTVFSFTLVSRFLYKRCRCSAMVLKPSAKVPNSSDVTRSTRAPQSPAWIFWMACFSKFTGSRTNRYPVKIKTAAPKIASDKTPICSRCKTDVHRAMWASMLATNASISATNRTVSERNTSGSLVAIGISFASQWDWNADQSVWTLEKLSRTFSSHGINKGRSVSPWRRTLRLCENSCSKAMSSPCSRLLTTKAMR